MRDMSTSSRDIMPSGAPLEAAGFKLVLALSVTLIWIFPLITSISPIDVCLASRFSLSDRSDNCRVSNVNDLKFPSFSRSLGHTSFLVGSVIAVV
jgi:hypothetical protein